MSRISADDAALWRRAMREVVPLRGRAPAPPPEFAITDRGRPDRIAGETPAVRVSPRPLAEPPPLDRFAGVDRATADRVRRGRYAIEARLDLHGLTQAEAHLALARFVAGSRAAGRRCVLVVTGHGRTSGGILKAAVPRWLNEPELRRHLLAIAPARPQHGADGALYLLLRKLTRT